MLLIYFSFSVTSVLIALWLAWLTNRLGEVERRMATTDELSTAWDRYQKAFTFGYQGRDPATLLEIVMAQNLGILDIRLSPRSQQAGWGKEDLQARFGDRYRWVPALGNKNYNVADAPVTLANLKIGLQIVTTARRDVILMCGCRRAESCHRTPVGALVAAEGIRVEELAWPEPEPGSYAALVAEVEAAYLVTQTMPGYYASANTGGRPITPSGMLFMYDARCLDPESECCLDPEREG